MPSGKKRGMKKTSPIHIRVSLIERMKIDQLAKRNGLNISEYIRRQVFNEKQIR